jgi:hypothetical protein
MSRLPAPKTSPALRGMTVESLLALAEALAAKHHDGHLICFRQTTCWQVAFDTARGLAYGTTLQLLPRYKSLRAALVALISDELERAVPR